MEDDVDRLDRLLERYVELTVRCGHGPRPSDLCGGDLQLEALLEARVAEYEQLEGLLRSTRRLVPGQRVSTYRVIAEVGRGGMSVVYSAAEVETGELVALKVLSPVLSTDEEHLERFAREARVIGQLRHPAIVRVDGLLSIDGMHILVLELVRGRPLSDLVDREGLPRRDVVRIGIALADALDCVHSAKVIHRDLKLSNLMLDEDGGLRVLDFGLARDEQAGVESLTSSGAMLGTVSFAAPEQLLGESVDARVDLFGFGCVLYHLASGEPPFSGATPVDVLDAVLNASPQFSHPRFRGELGAVIRNCLEKDPERRLGSAACARDRLLEIDVD